MNDNTIDVKLKQFNDFFSIEHSFNINAKPLINSQHSSYDDFITTMPTPFKLANDINALDQASLAPLGAVSGIAGQLVKYLNHQAQKIDLLVNHMLSEQDDQGYRHQGVTFGGGGIEFKTKEAFSINDILEVKIFLTHENAAIYCHSEVISVEVKENSNNEKEYYCKVVFQHIREDDRERLVRSSLHLQSKQLQELAKQRNQESNS